MRPFYCVGILASPLACHHQVLSCYPIMYISSPFPIDPGSSRQAMQSITCDTFIQISQSPQMRLTLMFRRCCHGLMCDFQQIFPDRKLAGHSGIIHQRKVSPISLIPDRTSSPSDTVQRSKTPPRSEITGKPTTATPQEDH